MNQENSRVIVIKQDSTGQEVWQYDGKVLSRTDRSLLLEARFNRSDLPFHGILLRENDRFLERYYQDRWYNIYELHDKDTGQLKGWYCNVTVPAVFKPGAVTYRDLALDLLAYPDGHYIILDVDEFEALNLDESTRQAALAGLDALVRLAESSQLGAAVQP